MSVRLSVSSPVSPHIGFTSNSPVTYASRCAVTSLTYSPVNFPACYPVTYVLLLVALFVIPSVLMSALLLALLSYISRHAKHVRSGVK